MSARFFPTGRIFWIGSIGAFLALSAFLIASRSRTSSPVDPGDVPPTQDRRRELLLGSWEDEFMGHRTLTFRLDGTATMVVKLKGLSAALYAEWLTFDEEWKLDGDRLKIKAIGGTPEAKTRLVLDMMGDTTDQKILELTDERLLLLDEASGATFDWSRVSPSSPPS